MMSRLQQIKNYVLALLGAPDYPAYLEHMQQVHPNVTPLERKEFFQQALLRKNGSRSISRCPC